MPSFIGSTQNAGIPQSISTSYKTLISLTAASVAPRQFVITDIMLSEVGDLVCYDLSQQTAAGSAASVDPLPLDPAWPTGFTKLNVNYDSEGTITADSSVFYVQTSSAFKWRAAPGREIISAGGTSNLGFALRAQSATFTGTCPATMVWSE